MNRGRVVLGSVAPSILCSCLQCCDPSIMSDLGLRIPIFNISGQFLLSSMNVNCSLAGPLD